MERVQHKVPPLALQGCRLITHTSHFHQLEKQYNETTEWYNSTVEESFSQMNDMVQDVKTKASSKVASAHAMVSNRLDDAHARLQNITEQLEAVSMQHFND